MLWVVYWFMFIAFVAFCTFMLAAFLVDGVKISKPTPGRLMIAALVALSISILLFAIIAGQTG